MKIGLACLCLGIAAVLNAAEPKLGADIAASGWDAVTGYGLTPSGVKTVGRTLISTLASFG